SAARSPPCRCGWLRRCRSSRQNAPHCERVTLSAHDVDGRPRMFRSATRGLPGAVLGALLLAACATNTDRGPGADAAGAGTVSVVTLNIYHDKAHWPKRR